MMQFLAEYGSTIVIGLVLAFIVFLAIRSMIKDKKNGKSSCGGSCASCGGCCGCKSAETSEKK